MNLNHRILNSIARRTWVYIHIFIHSPRTFRRYRSSSSSRDRHLSPRGPSSTKYHQFPISTRSVRWILQYPLWLFASYHRFLAATCTPETRFEDVERGSIWGKTRAWGSSLYFCSNQRGSFKTWEVKKPQTSDVDHFDITYLLKNLQQPRAGLIRCNTQPRNWAHFWNWTAQFKSDIL